MKNCKYSYYNKEENYYPKLYCKYNGGSCLYSKRCTMAEKYIHIDNFNEKECYNYIMNEQKNIPQDSYFLQLYRPNKKGGLFLYVVIDEKVTKIDTNLTEINQNYVYLKEGLDGYEVSLTPFIKEEKKTYAKKSRNYNGKEKRD